MTSIAALTTVLGSLILLDGLQRVMHTVLAVIDLLRYGAIDYPAGAFRAVGLLILPNCLMLGTGIVGLIAGIGIFILRPWARSVSLVFGALSVVSLILPYVGVFIFNYGGYGPFNVGTLDLLCFVISVGYSIAIFVIVDKRAWTIALAAAK